MCSRHYEHHHPEALNRRGRGVVLAALLLISCTAARAVDTVVSVVGEVHTVGVQPWSAGVGPLSTVVVHTVERANGDSTTLEIPGTAGIALEADPAIDVDPATDRPMVVWSRFEGSGFDLMLSRYEDGAWSEPIELYADGADNLEPHIRVGHNVVHVFWRQDGARRFRLCLDHATLMPVLPVEELPWDLPDDEAADGASGQESVPERDWTFFSYVAIAPGSDSGPVVVLGARDEPIPITYFELFSLPPELGAVTDSEVGFVSDTLVTTFVSGSRYYYSLFDAGAWSEFRVIVLSEDRTASDARVLLGEMLQRGE